MMELYAFGYNLDGQIQCDCADQGETCLHADCCRPTRISLSDSTDSTQDITSIAITWSWAHLIYTTEGRITVRGTSTNTKCKELCLPNFKVKDISSSWSKTGFVSREGACYICPKHDCSVSPIQVRATDDQGLLRLAKVAVGDRNIAAITENGHAGLIEEHPAESFIFRPILPSLMIREVSCGKEHTILLTRIGQVLTLGLGSRGQLGHGGTQSEDGARVVDALDGLTMLTVSAGGWHSAAVSDAGDVYTWGWNESGQLGLPCKAVRGNHGDPRGNHGDPSGNHGDIRSNQGDPRRNHGDPHSNHGDPHGNHGDPHGNQGDTHGNQGDPCSNHGNPHQECVNLLTVPHPVATPTGADHQEVVFSAVSCGSRHTAALTEGGEVFTWGWNGHGQLGLGDTEPRDAPTLVTYFQTNHLRAVKVVAGCWNTAVMVRPS